MVKDMIVIESETGIHARPATEISKEAMKYKRYKDYISNSRTAYEKAWKYGWLKEYTWLTKGGDKKEDIRTLDDCIKIAKQYKTYAEFKKNESLIYSYCKYKKWNKQIIWGK